MGNIRGSTARLFAKESVNGIASVLGMQLHAEYIDTIAFLHSLEGVFPSIVLF